MGKFLTCYSPVRHSASSCKQEDLAFDLHVLGMPPAFVLSQDQTLVLKEFRLTPVLSWFIVVISFLKLIKST